MRLTRFLVLILIFLFSSVAGWGQVATGFPSFGSFNGSTFDTVDNANLNVHFAIPVVEKAGRGIPFYYLLGYDSSVWVPATVSGSKVWTPVTDWGWQGITSAYAGHATYDWQEGSCYDYNNQLEYYDIYSDWAYIDPAGTSHYFGLQTSDAQDTAPDCVDYAPPYDATGTAADGSGYTMRASGGGAFVDSPQGSEYGPPAGSTSGNASVVDSNGNEVTVYAAGGTTTFTDTLGTTALQVTGSGTPSSPVVLTYKTVSGTSEPVTMNYTTYTVKTAFGCSSVNDFGPTQENLVSSIVLADGETYSFAYEPTPGSSGDITGRIASVTLPGGGTITYDYTGSNNGIECSDGSAAGLTRTVNPGGEWTYTRSQISGSHWQTTVKDPAGNSTTMDLEGLYETERQVPGLETVYTCYNGAGYPCNGTAVSLPITRRTVTTDLGGEYSQVDTQYSSLGLPTKVDDYDYGANGPGSLLRETQIGYKALAGYSTFYRPQTVSVYDGLGNLQQQVTLSYDGSGVTATSGTPQHFNISTARGNLTTLSVTGKNMGTLSESFTYYDTGNVNTGTDFDSNQTSFSYNDCGNSLLTAVVHPLSLETATPWDCNAGVITSAYDPNSKGAQFGYDAMNRLSSATYSDGGSVTISYSSNQITTTTAIKSGTSRQDITSLDGLGRVTGQTVRGVTTATTYNNLGQVGTVTIDDSGANDSYQYDALGRVTTITHADGNKIAISYPGNCKATTDEAGNTNTVCFDALGRVTKVTDALNNETDYTYDALNDLTGVTQGSQTRTFTYDGLGRLLSATTPESGTTTYSYTTSGGGPCSGDPSNVCSRTDARNITTTYTYDALNRLTQKSYDDGTPTANYSYDQSSVTIGSWTSPTLVNPLGRLTEATTTSGGSVQTGLVYSYDPMGRVADLYQCTPYNCGSSMWQMAYNYDLAGDVTSYTHPAGFTITNQIDQNQRITQVTSSLNDSTHPGTLATMTYNSWGALETLSNGCAGSGCTPAVETYAYNNRLQPVMMELGTSSNAAANYCLVYNYYQGEAQPASCTSTPGQASSGDDGAVAGYFYQDNANSGLGHTSAFTYDGATQLSTAVATGNSSYNLTFNTDLHGNMTCVQNGSTQGLCPQYTFNSNNQISNSGYTYDQDGDLTSDGTNSYQWNGAGQLSEVTQGSTVLSTNTYNALGLLVRRLTPSATIDLPHDASGRTTGFFNGAGGSWWEQQFWGGGELLGHYDNGTTYFIHRSGVGSTSPTQITDASGGLSGDEILYPMGQQWQYDNEVNVWWQFYGSISRFQADLGLYLTPNRFYSRDMGRWLSPDKLGGDVMNPQSLNRNAYANNNPTTFTDPLGLQSFDGYCDIDIDPQLCPTQCSFEDPSGCVPGCSPYDPEACGPNLCYEFGDCGFYPGGGGEGGGGGAAPPSVPPAGQPPLGGMGNAMFGGLVTCTNAKVTIGGVPYPVGPTTCGLTPLGVLGLWGGTFASSLFSRQSLTTAWNSTTTSAGCSNRLFTTFGRDLLPIPTEPSPADLAEPTARFFSIITFNQALNYAASRGLTYPFKSSVFRGLIQTSEKIGESAPEIAVVTGAGDAVISTIRAAYNGECH